MINDSSFLTSLEMTMAKLGRRRENRFLTSLEMTMATLVTRSFDCVEPFGVLASLEMTPKQKEKKKAFSGGEAAAKRPPLSHAVRVIPNAVRKLFYKSAGTAQRNNGATQHNNGTAHRNNGTTHSTSYRRTPVSPPFGSLNVIAGSTRNPQKTNEIAGQARNDGTARRSAMTAQRPNFQLSIFNFQLSPC